MGVAKSVRTKPILKYKKENKNSILHNDVASLFPCLGRDALPAADEKHVLNQYYERAGGAWERTVKPFIDMQERELVKHEEILSILPQYIKRTYIQHYVLIEWLRRYNPDISWDKLMSFVINADGRTYENSQVCYNFIVGRKEGKSPLDDFDIKILDPLGGSLNSFIRIDGAVNIVCTESTTIQQSLDQYDLILPEYLHTIHSCIKPKEYLVSRIRCGDILVSSRKGMVASRRHCNWMLYHKGMLRGMFKSFLRGYTDLEATNKNVAFFINILLKLSYMRHGALIIIDSNRQVLKKVKKESLLFKTSPKNIHDILAKKLQKMDLLEPEVRNASLLCELASIDGALIFDKTGLKAFGALIPLVDDTKNRCGARTAAAYAAAYHGAVAFKVSSDGDVKIYVKPNDYDSAVVEFQII